MFNKNTKKGAFLSSLVALVLCCSMFVGTTFAWFTDEVESGKNQIVAGNLDVELKYAKVTDGELGEFTTVSSAEDIFNPNALWEPGRVEVVYLEVSNLGTLALKYQLGVNIYDETPGINVEGVEFKLSEHLVFKAIELSELTRYSASEAVVAAGTEMGLKDYNGATTSLEVGGVDYVALIVYMPETVGNEANYRGTAVPTIELGVNLFATQLDAEADSFGPDYDKNAWGEGFKVYTEDDLNAAIAAGETDIMLMANIVTTETIVIPEGTSVTLNLNGKTLTGTMHKSIGAVIKNEGSLNLQNGTVSSTADNGGSAILNSGTAVLENVTLNGAPNADGSWPSYTVNNSGVMAVNNSKITSYHGAVACYDEGAVVTLKDSEIDMTGIAGFTNHGIYTYNSGTVVVSGGTYVNHAADQSSTGGSVINGAVTVNGGTFTGRIENYYGTPVIKGGTFTADPSKYVAEGYHALSYNGKYIVLPENVDAADTATLIEKIKNAPVGETTEIVLAGGTYTGNIDITLAALGQQGGDVVIKAAEGATPVFTGTVTLGLYQKGTTNVARYAANVTFDGITFDHAEDGNHSISIQNIGANGDATDTAALTLKNCTVIGDGEYGIGAVSGCIAYNSKITGCAFVNAGVQVSGNYGTSLVVDGCTFKESVINVQSGTGVTVQNSNFSNTVTDANNNESFYAIRSNAIPVTVTGCKFNVDSTVTGTGVAGSKGWGVFVNRGTTDWTVSDVQVTMTKAALAQPALNVATCTSTGKINMTNVTVNGATYVETADALATAVTNGATKIMLANGEYDMPHLGTKANGVTFIGESRDGVVIKLYNQNTSSGDFCLENATATLENMTFVTEIKDWAGFQNAEKLTFNNCKFVNNLFTTGNATFNDCEFEVTTNHYNVWAFKDMHGAYCLEFNRCVFNSTGKSIYVDGNDGKLITVKFNGCIFNDDDTCATDKAAIETGKTYGSSYDISVTGCTFNGFAVNTTGINTNSVIWANKASLTTEQLNVVIDGVDVY